MKSVCVKMQGDSQGRDLFETQQVYPNKIICVGRNYLEHIHELNNPVPEAMVLFHKPNSSITDQLNAFHDEPLHYESEICFLVEKGQLSAVGFGLDLTKRALQSKLKKSGLPWERAKAFQGSAVFSKFVPIKRNDWQHLSIELLINSMRVQIGDVSQMIYSPDVILKEVSSYLDFEDGDILMTGTPNGVGVVQQGDHFTARLRKGDELLIETHWTAH